MEIIINGVKTNFRIFGEGKPLFVLHGWGSNIERWKEVAEQISGEEIKVIIPDLPGFGLSEKLKNPWTINDYVKWFEEFAKEINVQDFYLAGHSFGGALAAKITVRFPQNVKKLFLISAALIRKKTVKKNIFLKSAKLFKLFSFLPFYVFFRKAVYKFIIRKSDYVYTDGVMKETYLNVISDDISFNLPFIKVPTTIIWGQKDDSTPIEDAYYMNKQIKNSNLIIIPEAGHDLNRKQPEILAQKILENL
jgi:pimeloyl-ACP methyl ester carboxylesterase